MHKRPRDSQGWRIPREGTKSWRVYVGLACGLTVREIAVHIEDDYENVAVLAWKIRNPEAANAIEIERLHRKAVK